MLFSTVLEDALYLSWAVPFEAVPSPPAPLRLERFPGPEGDRALITLVLFRQAGIRAEALGWPRLSYPQVNLRLAVLDEEAIASVLLLRELVPAWVVPIARTAGGQPASAALFGFPAPAPAGLLEPRTWSFAAGTRFEVRAQAGAPPAGGAVSFPSAVGRVRDRPRAYLPAGGRLRRIEREHAPAEAVPAAAEVVRSEWLSARLPGVDPGCWSQLWSAFLVPTARLRFELEEPRAAALPAQVPAPG